MKVNFYESHYTYTSMHFLVVEPKYNDQLTKKKLTLFFIFCIEG
jgi:hypothetical protein